MLPITKILCPTDFSDPSYAALEVANEFASHFSATLIMTHVVTSPHVVPMPEAVAAAKLATFQKEMEKWAGNALEEARSMRVPESVESRILLLKGDPAHEIVQAAGREDVGMIVIATHGHTGFRRLVSGSVAEKVARTSTKPVLIVQMPGNNDE